MTSLYRHLGTVFGCVRPRTSEDGPSAFASASGSEAEHFAGSESSSPMQPGTPDAMDLRAPASRAKPATKSALPPPPLCTPKTGADIASGLRYGVEVEHQGLTPNKVAKAVGDNLVGAVFDARQACIHGPDGRKWYIDHDAGGLELVTPILQGREDLQLLQKIVKSLAQQGAQADQRAGLHVHIDAARFSAKKMEALVMLMARNEHWLYPLWGVHHSRRSQWCTQMDLKRVDRYLGENEYSARQRLLWFTGGNRYYGLNLQNYLCRSAKHTVEFRYLNGTLDGCAIGCAVGFYMALAEHALQGPGQNTKTAVQRSSLPALLREMDIDPTHPVAAHLYDQLRTRIAAGWRTAEHGPLPDLHALMRDDAFVEQLCNDLDVRDGAAQVANAAHQLLYPGATPVPDLLPYIERLAHGGVSPLTLEENLQALARHAYDPRRLLAACDIASHMITRTTFEDRVQAVQDFLAWPGDALERVHAVIASMPGDAGKKLGHRVVEMHETGEDVLALGKRLHACGDLLVRHPHRAFNAVLVEMCQEGRDFF